MKKDKKFSENCIAVDDHKRHTVLKLMAPLALLMAIFVLLPWWGHTDARESFSYVQAPLYWGNRTADDIQNSLYRRSLSKKKLVRLCEELLRENAFLEVQLKNMAQYLPLKMTDRTSSTWPGFRSTYARVVRRDLIGWQDELVINVGAEEGIKENMGVIARQSVIGKIVHVGAHVSTVQLISSPQFRMVVHIKGDDSETPVIFSGNSSGLLEHAVGIAEHISAEKIHHQSEVVLISSRMSKAFPGGMKVGVVDTNNLTGEGFLKGEVVLDNDLINHLQEVTVVACEEEI